MKNFSLLEEIFESVEGETEKLTGMVSRSKLDAASIKYETRVPQLEYMCLIMENMVLTKKPKAKIYAGFQKFSRAVDPVLDRFIQMTDFAEKVYIFGENDKAMPKNTGIEFVSLPKGNKLIREWFLIIDSPTMKQMMVAYDLDGFGVKELEEDRNFKGVKSIKPAIIKKATSLIEEVIASK